MKTTDFNRPAGHPYGMLSGIIHAYETESLLAWMLTQCINAGDFIPVQTVASWPTAVHAGLLNEEGERLYTLTAKAKGLLYSVYGKD